MRLVLVEDDVRLARVYQRHLERADYQVEVFHEAESARGFLLCEWRTIAVIILDILLPGESGIDLCRALRRAGVRTPTLILTALDQTADKVAGLDAGGDDYLTKPFPLPELLARLRALVRRAEREGQATITTQIRVGDLLIDQLAHEVYRANQLISLTRREYTLLEALAQHANQTLSRDWLSRQVWPEGTDAGSNVLDTYIHHLRDKLDVVGAEPMIQTVRGVGYALRTPGMEPAR